MCTQWNYNYPIKPTLSVVLQSQWRDTFILLLAQTKSMESSLSHVHNISYSVHQQYYRLFHWHLSLPDQFSPPHFSHHCLWHQIWCFKNKSHHIALILQGFPIPIPNSMRRPSRMYMIWATLTSITYPFPLSFILIFILSPPLCFLLSQILCQANSCLDDLAFCCRCCFCFLFLSGKYSPRIFKHFCPFISF